MAKRKFVLPGIHELSKEQEHAIRLPLEGCHLIVGGPGTGKTVVTLLRMRRFIQTNNSKKSVFLVYNRLLHAAAQQLFGSEINSATWQSWFTRIYLKYTKDTIPRIETDSDFQPIDWPSVMEKVSEMEIDEPPEGVFIVIDEGQDMPPAFYDALIRLGFENFYVVADQNQAITAENSSRKQLEDSLAIDMNNVIELDHNYRNRYCVARLAQEFYPKDPSTPPLRLPSTSSLESLPLLIEYGDGCRLNFDGIIDRILKLADRDTRNLLGIITPNNSIRKKYLEALRDSEKHKTIQLDNGNPRIETYAYGEKCSLRFDEGGIFVINAQSCKGLEFDTVFVADINAFPLFPAIEDEKKRLFYVMVARAIEQVVFLKESTENCPVEKLITNDTEILRYWR